MQKSSEYWKKRFGQLEQSQHDYSLQTYKDIETAFDKAQSSIQSQIDGWYARFAENNGVSLQDARKLLTGSELKELQWDVDDYIKYGRENAMNKQWMTQLENASAKFHITRLEALKLRTQQELEKAFGNETDSVDQMARKIYTEGYYHTAFEIQKGVQVGWNIGQIDERTLEKVITKPWAADGKNFSSRIWDRKAQTVNELHQELTRMLIQGKAPDEAIKHMSKFVDGKVKNAKYAAGRLVQTEEAYFHSVSQKEAFNDLGVEEYEIVATLDSRTSEICQDMDGQHFPMKDYDPGATAPPFHPNCRSVTVPYFEDNDDIGERAARNADGKTYYVPAKMTYKDWKQTFVDGDTSALQPTKNIVKAVKKKFIPAETIEQAEEYAKQFVVDKSWSGNGNVSFKGVDIDTANSINETLANVFEDTDIPKLRNIQPMNLRKKEFKGSEDAPFAYRGGLGGDFFFNPKILKSKKTIEAYQKNGLDAFNYCKAHLDELTGHNKEVVEKYIKAGRQIIADDCENFLKATVEHEIGHHIQHSVIFKNKDYLDIVKKGMEKYGIKISGYATSSVGEYIAESFSAYRNGYADLIDPELKKIFEGLVK